MANLQDRVALVTGASRGVGRGIAVGLAHAGARVYATGRRIAETDLGEGIVAIPCDHTDDRAVDEVFQRIDRDAGRLDILVNSAWGGYERMVEDGRFTWGARFWEQPRWRWDAICRYQIGGVERCSLMQLNRCVPRNFPKPSWIPPAKSL